MIHKKQPSLKQYQKLDTRGYLVLKEWGSSHITQKWSLQTFQPAKYNRNDTIFQINMSLALIL
jgi:hypothetical protein